MLANEFKIVGEEKSCTISCNLNVFSDNMSEISRYASELGGTTETSNVIRVPSDEAFVKMVNTLLTLTIPARNLSKKR